MFVWAAIFRLAATIPAISSDISPSAEICPRIWNASSPGADDAWARSETDVRRSSRSPLTLSAAAVPPVSARSRSGSTRATADDVAPDSSRSGTWTTPGSESADQGALTIPLASAAA